VSAIEPQRPNDDAELKMLMQRYRADDPAAFAGIHRRLGGCLRTFFRRKGLKTVHAEDLVQETFLQIHKARGSYDPSRGVKPWVYGIARNVYLMDRRAAGRRPSETVATEDEAESTASPDAARLHDRAWVHDAVARVRPERRIPLILRHVWGYSFKEIAAALGIGESAAKVRSHRAMNELRALLLNEPTRSTA
jgi:RNA polymerase sigma-70 factor (ECF subfamily)